MRDIPPPRRPRKYPWPEMAVGEDRFLPLAEPTRISTSLYIQKQRYGRVYTYRQMKDENGMPGIRVWRLS